MYFCNLHEKEEYERIEDEVDQTIDLAVFLVCTKALMIEFFLTTSLIPKRCLL